jgi:hypothetical protein
MHRLHIKMLNRAFVMITSLINLMCNKWRLLDQWRKSLCSKSQWLNTHEAPISSPGGLQSHCSITALEGMFITVSVSPQRAVKSWPQEVAAEKSLPYPRGKNMGFSRNTVSVCHTGLSHRVNSLMFPEVWFLRKLFYLQKPPLLWVVWCLLRCDFQPKTFPHRLHWQGFSTVWVFSCFMRCDFRPKVFPHWLHI